ncbi:MAG: hypothetical protein CL596_05305 [Alteromonas sp.]|nr:hypothetical protein [Alteromonas sp.]|tara:strand:+ start:2330 stop:2689 length:360 start_codon:yes stop_codon:yes gene_type:complete
MEQSEFIKNFNIKGQTDFFNFNRGKVIISNSFIKTSPPELLSIIFSKIIPIDINPEYGFNVFDNREYHCLSMEFDKVKEGEVIPEYLLIIEPIINPRKNGPTPVNINIIDNYKISFHRV